jgi:sulfane dehydrogenase subunit SoxC
MKADPSASSRRGLLRATTGAAAAAALVAARAPGAAAANAENLPPNLPEWGRALGPGVIEEPYGKP